MTVTYAEPKPSRSPTDEDLVLEAARNSTQLMIDVDDNQLPRLFAVGGSIETIEYSIAGSLTISSWAETLDFRGEQDYWITAYKRRIAAGDDYLKPRLEDYDRIRRRAEEMELAAGSSLPVNVLDDGKLISGCLILTSRTAREFRGRLYVGSELISTPVRLNRVVRWNGRQFEAQVAEKIRFLNSRPGAT